MIPVFQTKFKGVNGSQCGNCLAASIASILEIPLFLVPQFEEGFISHGAKWQLALARFTAGHGFATDEFGKDPMLDRPYLATGASPRSTTEKPFNHCVVYQSGKLLHDPHPSGEGVVDPFFFAVYRSIDYQKLESTTANMLSDLNYLLELQND
jgi:hypothetical protein